jgi:hypothetical protein
MGPENTSSGRVAGLAESLATQIAKAPNSLTRKDQANVELRCAVNRSALQRHRYPAFRPAVCHGYRPE